MTSVHLCGSPSRTHNASHHKAVSLIRTRGSCMYIWVLGGDPHTCRLVCVCVCVGGGVAFALTHGSQLSGINVNKCHQAVPDVTAAMGLRHLPGPVCVVERSARLSRLRAPALSQPRNTQEENPLSACRYLRLFTPFLST